VTEVAAMTTWIQQHGESLLGATLGVIFSIPVAFYVSLYAGLIVARRARFEDLRYELIRILQSLEWPPGSQKFVLTGNHRLYDIRLISADLFSLGHSSAGEMVAAIEGEMSIEFNRRENFLSADQKEQQFTAWMRAVRTMKSNKWYTLDPRPRLYRKVEYGREHSCPADADF
jgi:hypothetical protein